MLSNFFIIPVVRETIGAPTKLTEDIIQTPPLVVPKTIKILSMQSNAATYLLNFLLQIFFD